MRTMITALSLLILMPACDQDLKTRSFNVDENTMPSFPDDKPPSPPNETKCVQKYPANHTLGWGITCKRVQDVPEP